MFGCAGMNLAVISVVPGCKFRLLPGHLGFAIRGQIQALVPNSEILDPAAPTARELIGSKRTHGQADPPDLVLTTGDPIQSRRAARLALGINIGRFVRIELVWMIHQGRRFECP